MAKFSGVADVKNKLKATAEEENTIIGGNLADKIYGGSYNDNISGGSGNDYIYTGNGRNEVNGDAGDDTIVGGTSNDIYIMETGEGNDIIIDRGGTDSLTANFLTSATSGVFIKRGNDLIVAEGTINLTGDADGDGDDTEDLTTEIAGIQALTSAAARQAGMRSIVKNLTNSAVIKNHFTTGEIEGISSVQDETIAANLVNYSTGLKYFNQAVTNPNVVWGTGASDHIITSKNGQILKGGKGNDTYYIDNHTDVIIDDTDGTFDHLIFADSDATADTFLYTKEGNNLKITFDDGATPGGEDSSVIIRNFYSRKNAQIERVSAERPGAINTDASYLKSICDKVTELSSAARVLRGSVTDDRFIINADQTVYGYAGDDEYTVTAGKAVIIDNGNGTSPDGDTLNADHIATETDGVFIRKGNDLIILDGGDDPDGVGGYADADAAIADLPNLTKLSQRRAVLNTLMKATDSITVKNYFTTGVIETINALNNTEINLNQEIVPNLIDYRTGLLMSNNGTGKARVNGTGSGDYIFASANNQKLYGSAGNDIYAIPLNITGVEIYDTIGDLDKVVFTDADFDGGDTCSIEQVGNDLQLTVSYGGGGSSSATIKNHFLRDNSSVERVDDADAGYYYYVADAIFEVNGVERNYTYGSAGDDTILGRPEIGNALFGGDGNDFIYGVSEINDTIFGGAGNDTLKGGAQYNDNLNGEEGSDVYELPANSGNNIVEVDATSDDTDKVVFKDADFTEASGSISIMRLMNMAVFSYTDGDGISTTFTMNNYYAGGSDQIEVLEDADGNSINLVTGAVTGTVNVPLSITGDLIGGADTITAPDTSTKLDGGGDNDNLTGGTGNDTIEGGDGNDIALAGGDGNDWIDGGDGDDVSLDGGAGNDTIIGGLGDDGMIITGADNDVVLYDLDSGNAAGADVIFDFTIGEDVVRFTTSANDILGLDFRNHIAVRDTGAGLEIGYGWDEAAQDYDNTVTMAVYDDASVLTDNVIEFVTADGTTALTAAEITAILADIAADGDAPGTLAAVHDDIDAGAGGNDGQLLVDSINAAW